MKYDQTEAYKKKSKDRLLKIVTNKQKTIMIGALNHFEKVFGVLWGDDRDDVELSSEEMAIRDLLRDSNIDCEELWQVVRTRILDYGNRLIRNTENEFEQYSMVWNRYNLQLPVRRPSNEN